MANIVDARKLWQEVKGEGPKENDQGDPLTEDALALRFSERHAGDLRFIAVKSQWLRWDGMRWRPENTGLAFDLVRDSCRTDAREFGNGNAPPRIYSAKTVAAVQRFAAADRRQAATIEQWDADPYLLNTAGETFDLRTGESRSPNPSDYITKTTACPAAAFGTPYPLWSAFLERILPDPEVRQFLQRFIGYCLTGETREHVFVFGYGTGANGKSTFINTIVKIFEDYAAIADVGTFIASDQERHPTDVAKLHGPRLVVAQETDKGRRWDEAKIKSLTGGDKMTARFMRCDFFDFTPVFKLFVTGNHKPQLNNVDEAMRRRLLLVPLTVQIPPGERDPDLPERLAAEGPAILRWAIDGCLEWRRMGLCPPAAVMEATKDYFADQDMTQQWLDDCIADGGPFAFTRASELFASWKSWCDERGLKPGSGKALTEALEDRGHQKTRAHGGVRGFKGIVVKSVSAGSGDTW